jgi:hypothetical protein
LVAAKKSGLYLINLGCNMFSKGPWNFWQLFGKWWRVFSLVGSVNGNTELFCCKVNITRHCPFTVRAVTVLKNKHLQTAVPNVSDSDETSKEQYSCCYEYQIL